MNNIKLGKTPGVSGIYPEYIRHSGNDALHALHRIFTRVWEEEVVPEEWHQGLIIPLYKGKTDVAGNQTAPTTTATTTFNFFGVASLCYATIKEKEQPHSCVLRDLLKRVFKEVFSGDVNFHVTRQRIRLQHRTAITVHTSSTVM